MKAFLNWTKRHRILSTGILLVLLFIVALIKACSVKRNLGVLTEPIQRGTIMESVYGIGTVTARNSYQLKLGVTSTIKKLLVVEGDHVKRGKPLVDLEGTGAFSAPFDGTITYLPVKAGETVFAQGVILTLVDLIDRYVVVSLEQRAAVRVCQGQRAKLSFENMREQSFDGVVQSVYSNENNFLVRIGVENLPQQLLPGMTADVSIAIAEHTNVLVIPTVAIDAGKVYVKRGHERPEAVEVKTGTVDGTMAEVVSGELHVGDQLYIRRVTP